MSNYQSCSYCHRKYIPSYLLSCDNCLEGSPKFCWRCAVKNAFATAVYAHDIAFYCHSCYNDKVSNGYKSEEDEDEDEEGTANPTTNPIANPNANHTADTQECQTCHSSIILTSSPNVWQGLVILHQYVLACAHKKGCLTKVLEVERKRSMKHMQKWTFLCLSCGEPRDTRYVVSDPERALTEW